MADVRRAIQELARQGLDARTFVSRASLHVRECVPFDVPDGPGVLVVDGHGDIVSASETAAGWLDVLRGALIGPQLAVPVPVVAVAARTRAAGQTRLRVRTGDGHWLTLDGARQRSPTQGRIHTCDDQMFVTIARSRSSEVMPLIARQYGLTPPELTLLGLILRGLSTRRISEQLCISEYTVQDHLKSIFKKTASAAAASSPTSWRSTSSPLTRLGQGG